MILMVPISPEVPSLFRPRLWQGFVLSFILILSFLENHHILKTDADFVSHLPEISRNYPSNNAEPVLRSRPLLKIAPSKGSWDLNRLLQANFVHGNIYHLGLNLIGAFAGARICATFIPFLLTLSIFIIGGSLGLFTSILFSSEISNYIPHLGASAGIFAMMGTYYVYNFRFRTQYFFWFPSKHGVVPLKTSWFFFLDVIVLELILSTAQFMPLRIDNVDHLAHVVGFASGMLLALIIRTVQKWPDFIQTRGEFLFWQEWEKPKKWEPAINAFMIWVQILQLNPFNDEVKKRLFKLCSKHIKKFKQDHINYAFQYLNPSFIRRFPLVASHFIKQVLDDKKVVPMEWMKVAPYDVIILSLRYLAQTTQDYPSLIEFLTLYQKTQEPKVQENLQGLIDNLKKNLPPLDAPRVANLS